MPKYHYRATIASDPLQQIQCIINNGDAEDIFMYGMTRREDGIVEVAFTSPHPLAEVRKGLSFYRTTKIKYTHKGLVPSFPNTDI